jgi:hypothetical protein
MVEAGSHQNHYGANGIFGTKLVSKFFLIGEQIAPDAVASLFVK